MASLWTEAGSSFNFGVKNAKELKSYGKGIDVIDEWSFMEDRRLKPSILRLFGHFKTFTRSQWTVRLSFK